MTQEIKKDKGFIPPATPEEAYSRKEQFLDSRASSFLDVDMDSIERRAMGIPADVPKGKELDWLITQLENKNTKTS